MAKKFKTLYQRDTVDVPAGAFPTLRDLVEALFPEANPSEAVLLHFNRKNPSPTNPKGEGLTATLIEVLEITEQDLADRILAGDAPVIHAIEDE